MIIKNVYSQQLYKGNAKNLAGLINQAMEKKVVLDEMDLQRTDLSNSKFKDYSFFWSNFEGANLAGCIFNGINLSASYMDGANCSCTTFINCNMQDVDLQDIVYWHTDFVNVFIGKGRYISKINVRREDLI